MLGKKYLMLALILGSISTTSFGFTLKNPTKTELKLSKAVLEDNEKRLYEEIGLNGKLNYDVFKTALNGYNKIDGRKKELLTIIDYSKPSTEKRFFVIDMDKKELLVYSHVSHGKNSGGNIATSFSNKVSSYKSSLGFFLTENTYMGGNGYSLVLNGLEKGINDKAKDRYIVIHGADYANPKIAKSQGRLGRSLGCPALPKDISKKAIDMIKNGSVLFVYGNDTNYLERSNYV
ncbi:MAG: murein L,D-transpeptidase catalytic domain family protein [Cetobacterium sp.]|uniref:murein L,D-transpeptidase catalytic domain family protein n=1 Tax=Cetobacterium TaxID=180162 RepID=UPI001F065FFB|nr:MULTISPECIES: murein L,D-transpeptidase catalytic domain family protein [Cetobacterium]MCX3066188.1 murein L,D-transpeptidase catalytic domain family protein [Cetobacterium somerae]UPO96669.1 murein L,D-transpeptidase catalytic domain family protein [Cetobacterium somerae]